MHNTDNMNIFVQKIYMIGGHQEIYRKQCFKRTSAFLFLILKRKREKS